SHHLHLPYFTYSQLNRHPPQSTLFPYTTLFRSRRVPAEEGASRRGEEAAPRRPRGAGGIVYPSGGADRRARRGRLRDRLRRAHRDRKSTRLNSSHVAISYAVFCLKKKKKCRI